jgi:hypothetical protein
MAYDIRDVVLQGIQNNLGIDRAEAERYVEMSPVEQRRYLVRRNRGRFKIVSHGLFPDFGEGRNALP